MVLSTLSVTVDDPEVDFIQFGVDESYELSVGDAGATIRAPTVFGAMHGLEVRDKRLTSLLTVPDLLPTRSQEAVAWSRDLRCSSLPLARSFD
jgi:hypothetical protein